MDRALSLVNHQLYDTHFERYPTFARCYGNEPGQVDARNEMHDRKKHGMWLLLKTEHLNVIDERLLPRWWIILENVKVYFQSYSLSHDFWTIAQSHRQ